MNTALFAAFCLAQVCEIYLLWLMWQKLRTANRYRLSRARAAASHYRTALVLYAQGLGKEVDPDEMAAFAAAIEMDDLDADGLRAEALADKPDT